MPRKYVKKGTRMCYSEQQMTVAIREVLGGKAIKSAALEHNVPRTTLQAKLRKNPENFMDAVNQSGVGSPKIFNDEEEKLLCEYIVGLQRKMVGLSGTEVRRLAFQLAERLNRSHRFNVKTGLAGEDWLASFIRRHRLAHRKAEPTSIARRLGFNKQAVQKFFQLLQDVLTQYNFCADDIYNCDETGVTVNPKTGATVLAPKGEKQVAGASSAERGETVTAEICFNAAGKFMPLLLIFPRVRSNDEYLTGAPANSTAEFHKSGWMQTDIFVRWLKTFIQFSGATKETPKLLILDGHSTHVKSLEVIDVANENGVVILCLPPHCTHKLQPADVSVMKPISTYYTQEVTQWLRKHPGRKVSLYQIYELFGSAFLQAAKMASAVNGFKTTGIWPYDPEKIYTKYFPDIRAPAGNVSTSSSDATRELPQNQPSDMIISPLDSSSTLPIVDFNSNTDRSEPDMHSSTALYTSTVTTVSNYVPLPAIVNQEIEPTSSNMKHFVAQKNQLKETSCELTSHTSGTETDELEKAISELDPLFNSKSKKNSNVTKAETKNTDSAYVSKLKLDLKLDNSDVTNDNFIIEPRVECSDQSAVSISLILKRKCSGEKAAAEQKSKKSRQGATAVVTSPEYRENLAAEKKAANEKGRNTKTKNNKDKVPVEVPANAKRVARNKNSKTSPEIDVQNVAINKSSVNSVIYNDSPLESCQELPATTNIINKKNTMFSKTNNAHPFKIVPTRINKENIAAQAMKNSQNTQASAVLNISNGGNIQLQRNEILPPFKFPLQARDGNSLTLSQTRPTIANQQLYPQEHPLVLKSIQNGQKLVKLNLSSLDKIKIVPGKPLAYTKDNVKNVNS